MLYSALNDYGLWKASWTEVGESIHGLAEMKECLEHISASENAGCFDNNAGTIVYSETSDKRTLREKDNLS